MKDNYIGSLKIQSTKYGDIYKVIMSGEDLEDLIRRMKEEDLKLAMIDFKKKREPSEKGYTHYGELNTYKPEKSKDFTF